MTLQQFSKQEGVKIPTLQKRLQRAGLGCPGAAIELSNVHLSALSEKTKTRKVSMPFRTSAIERTKDNGQKTEPTTDIKKGSEATDKKDNTAFYVNGGITSLSVVLTIAGLYLLCGFPGIFLGLMIALFLLFSVWVACKQMKGDTSGLALKKLLWLEVMLIPLHGYTFFNKLPNDWHFYALVAVSFGLASLVPYVSYTAVQSLRNFHAEV